MTPLDVKLTFDEQFLIMCSSKVITELCVIYHHLSQAYRHPANDVTDSICLTHAPVWTC